MSEILAQLSQYPVSTRLSLSGTIIVARDIAHAKLKELIDNGAGAAAVTSKITRSTTQVRPRRRTVTPPALWGRPPQAAWTLYVDLLQSHGASKIMLAKGNRSQQVTDACHKHGGFYLGSIGGPAAVLAQQSIKSLECVAYPELGMEAIWKIEVEDFPAFILVDDKGNDFFQQIQTSQCARCVSNPGRPSGRRWSMTNLISVRVSAFLPGGGFRLTRPTKNSNINKLCSSL
ncbi:fumarate hydratase C-terminal domain-containing protein [Klebsiella pneumoniae subsp. pneumoniae]|nr:fumarate hydratase C-terminal domain-containing protein [Klebsiella pneumoniae subsp. pneumoniae]